MIARLRRAARAWHIMRRYGYRWAAAWHYAGD